MRPESPKCRCAERREALARAKEAEARGDTVAAQVELDFVKQSLIDDAKLFGEYSQKLRAHYAERVRGSFRRK